jgi:hypothetical protein
MVLKADYPGQYQTAYDVTGGHNRAAITLLTRCGMSLLQRMIR